MTAVMNTNTAQRWYEGEYQGDLVYMHYSPSFVVLLQSFSCEETHCRASCLGRSIWIFY